MLEAKGGEAAPLVATQFGLTACVLSLAYMQSAQQFKFFPLAVSKSQSYAKIGFAFLAAFMFGHSFVSKKFGNKEQFNYLYFN